MDVERLPDAMGLHERLNLWCTENHVQCLIWVRDPIERKVIDPDMQDICLNARFNNANDAVALLRNHHSTLNCEHGAEGVRSIRCVGLLRLANWWQIGNENIGATFAIELKGS